MTGATIPQSGFGTTISWEGHDIGYLLDVGYSGISSGTLENSSHESRWKTFVGGQIDGGEVNIPIRFIPGDMTGQQEIYKDIKTQTERQVIITLPDSSTWTFDAIATKFGDFTFPVEGYIDAVLVLKVTGEPAFNDFA